jgi:hypothetical protein
MRWLVESATKAEEPSEEILTPWGYLKRALEPTPSVEPRDKANPAREDTEAVERTILRMR